MRTVLVTGGTGALGSAVVRAFADAGDDVHATYLAEPEADRLRQGLGERAARVTLHRVDLTDEAAMEALVRDLEAAGRTIGVLVAAAGGFTAGRVEATDARTWRRMIDLNATSAFVSARAVLPGMKRRSGGRIVTVGAHAALRHGAPGSGAYAASKAALLHLTETLAAEYGPLGITANAILPTIMDTAANRRDMPDADTSRWLQVDEVAAVILFLASDAARIVNGSLVCLG